MLTVMLSHSDCSLLPLVEDIVQDILVALDLSYDHTATLFCSVLHALMKALGEESNVMHVTSFRNMIIISIVLCFPVERWFPSSRANHGDSASTGEISAYKEDLNVRQFLLDYLKQKELAEGTVIEEDDSEDLGNKEL